MGSAHAPTAASRLEAADVEAKGSGTRPSASYWREMIRLSKDEKALVIAGADHQSTIVRTLAARTVFLLVLCVVGVLVLNIVLHVHRAKMSLLAIRPWFENKALAKSKCGALSPAPFPAVPGPTFCSFDCLCVNLFYPSLASFLSLGVSDFDIGAERARFLVHMLTLYGNSFDRRAWAGDVSVVDIKTFIAYSSSDSMDNDDLAASTLDWSKWNVAENCLLGLFPEKNTYQTSAVCLAAATDHAGSIMEVIFQQGLCGWAKAQTESTSAADMLSTLFAVLPGMPPKMDCTAQRGLAIVEGVSTGATVAGTVGAIGLSMMIIPGFQPVGAIVAAAGFIAGGFLGFFSGQAGVKDAQAQCDEKDVEAEASAAYRWCIASGMHSTSGNNDAYCKANAVQMAMNATNYEAARRAA